MTSLYEKLKKQKEARGETVSESNTPVTEDRQLEASNLGESAIRQALSAGGLPGMLAGLMLGSQAEPTEENDAGDALAKSFANAGTFGAAGAIDRIGGGLSDSILSSDEEMDAGDFIAQRTADRDKLMGENPGSAITGGLLGGLFGATGAGRLATEAAPALMKSAGSTIARRLGTAAGTGAASSLATEAGEGDIDDTGDALWTMLTGGVGAGLGQAVGEGLSAAARGVRGKIGLATDNDLNVMANEALTGSGRKGEGTLAAAANAGKGFTPDELMAAAGQQRPGMALSETDPRLLNVHAGLAAQPEASGMLEPTRELAERRLKEMPQDMQQALLDNLITSNKGVTGQIDDAKAAAAATKQQGKDILGVTLDNDFATKRQVADKKKFIGATLKATDDQGNPLFDVANAAKSVQNTHKFFVDLVQTAGHNAKGMTLKMMHNIKMDIDKAIRGSSDATSADRLSGRELVLLKKYMNEQIGNIDPDYLTGAAKYAEGMKAEEAMEMGGQLISGTNRTLPVSEVSSYMNTLNPAERASVQSGALEWIAGEMDEKANFVAKVAKSPALRQRLNLVFGDVIDANATSVDDIAENIDTLLQQRKVFTDMAKASDPSKQISNAIKNKKDASKGQHLIDLAAIGGKVGTGQLTSGTLWSNARRFIGNAAAPENVLLLDLLQETDPDKAAKMLTGILHADKRNAGMTGTAISNALLQGINAID